MRDADEFIQEQHAYALAVMRLVYGLTDDEIVRRLEAEPTDSPRAHPNHQHA